MGWPLGYHLTQNIPEQFSTQVSNTKISMGIEAQAQSQEDCLIIRG